MKVLITPRGFAGYGLDQIKRMEDNGLTVHYNNTGLAYTKEQFQTLAADADAIIVGVDIIDKSIIDSCSRLKAICKFGVGTDNIDVGYAEEKGIFVDRTLGSNSKAVAEHVLALMMAEAKHLYQSIKEVKDNKWNKLTGREMNGKVLGIVGFGTIGKYLAQFVKGLNMKVYVYDTVEIPEEVIQEYQVTKSTLEEIIAISDYISLHVPLVESTKNMIGKKELGKMKPEACLINSARGGVVDEEALYYALVNNEIRSACFDVFSTEPPAKGHKLLSLENFFLTPHSAARTVEAEQRTCQISTDIILKRLLNSGEVQ